MFYYFFCDLNLTYARQITSLATFAPFIRFRLIACQKEYRPGFSLDPNNPPAETVKAGISGRVVNEKNDPIEGAMVTAGNRNATTDYNGYFNLENATVNYDAAYIKVDLQGYFPGSRTITARENGSHYIQVELIPVKKSGEFESASGNRLLNSPGHLIDQNQD